MHVARKILTGMALTGLIASLTAVRAADTGSITGTLTSPGSFTAVTAIDRQSGTRFAGLIDVQAGRFAVANLKLDQDYDIILDTVTGRLEGVNLKVPRSDYEEEQPLSPEDADIIRSKIQGMQPFENEVQILALTGNIQHAAILLNKLRSTPFYGSKPGEVVWRLELWHYEKPEETWLKAQEELFIILYRERLSREAYDRKAILLDPRLGGLRPTAQISRIDAGVIAPPDGKPGIRLRASTGP